jgi:hypothetical protein
MAQVTMREPRGPKAAESAPIPSKNTKTSSAMPTPFRDGETITRKDARNRTLTIKQLSLLEEMDLLAAAGADNARNSRWMLYATMAACVRSIDGDPLQPIPNLRLLRSRVQHIGAEGVRLVSEIIAAETPPDDEDGEMPGFADDVAATAKN